MSKEVRLRFAPSPTGYLHVGGLRTALYNYLFAKKNNGKFILRIEDTDRNRFVEGAVENLISSLKWAGLNFDEGPGIGGAFGPYTQSERVEKHKEYAQKLIEAGVAYYCFCTPERLTALREEQKANKQDPKYDKKCLSLSREEIQQKIDSGEPYVIRLNLPTEGSVTVNDLVRGDVTFDYAELDDSVLIKSDGYPTYHMANVVDDHYMEISHVFRAEEWLISTPKHLLMYKALGWEPPIYAHLPLLLNEDKSKLSKRQCDVAVEDYMAKGYLPEALVNFVALLGWNRGDDEEFFTMDDLIRDFSIERVSKSGAVFNVEKLDWMNGNYIRKTDLSVVCQISEKYFSEAGIDTSDKTKFEKVINLISERVAHLDQIVDHAKVLYNDFDWTEEQKEILHSEDAQTIYKYLLECFAENKNPEFDDIKRFVKKGSKKLGIKGKNYFWPLRLVLFGDTSGPDIPLLIDALGIEMTVKRIEKALI